MSAILIFSRDKVLNDGINSVCEKLNYSLKIVQELEDFILEIEAANYFTVIINCADEASHCLKRIQMVKRMRPKTPMIVIAEDLPNEILREIYSEGIFYFYSLPFKGESMKQVIESAVKFKMREMSKDRYINELRNDIE